jgi:FdhD protein
MSTVKPDPPTASAAGGTLEVQVQRMGPGGSATKVDRVAVEAPLEFQLHHPALGMAPVSFGTTMRTPGDDEVLAVGLLYGEGIVNQSGDIESVESSTRRPNVVNVRLQAGVPMELGSATHRFSAGSSCGICGTTGLDATIARAAATRISASGRIELSELLTMPKRMREQQSRFSDTGGIHAAALFDFGGHLLDIAEDVGRHNAFDKLVGSSLMSGRIPLADHVVILSGRASFELVQKAIRAGLSVLAAIGAPSSLAVNLSAASGLTLIGFLRESHCNIYSHPQRLAPADRGHSAGA